MQGGCHCFGGCSSSGRGSDCRKGQSRRPGRVRRRRRYELPCQDNLVWRFADTAWIFQWRLGPAPGGHLLQARRPPEPRLLGLQHALGHPGAGGSADRGRGLRRRRRAVDAVAGRQRRGAAGDAPAARAPRGVRGQLDGHGAGDPGVVTEPHEHRPDHAAAGLREEVHGGVHAPSEPLGEGAGPHRRGCRLLRCRRSARGRCVQSASS
mmetsp:Transcript_104079/g.303856  ORF Transcript_104079/g.303856 Transcript_104079/m.303856 type:complete len:208 (+) Transcript_104079:248-871(+)